MYKKIAVVTITILFLSLVFSATAFSSEINEAEQNTSLGFKSIFSSFSIINIGFDEEAVSEYIIPLDKEYEIPLKIYYQIFGIFANWHALRYQNRLMEIKLSIAEKPEWCTAKITPSDVDLKIMANFDDPATANVSLFIQVNEEAPAFVQGTITIEASVPAIKGFFGITTKITECKVYTDIPFVVGYIPIISLETEFNSKEISPLDVTKIPINITNFGNGPTEVLIEIEEIPEKWNISYPEKILVGSPVLGEDNEAEIVIDVRPYKHFSHELINISFTPRYFAGVSGFEGSTYVLGISLKNDGSLKEKNGFEINAILLVVVIVVIVLILVFAIILKRKKE